ncbi:MULTISPECIES: hypothetical protein [Glutamicibacter]|uniref:hypothetical protein n=1 Tax=Glutamicibacter TaxID=1742989 RepID=UPI00167F296B|nr:hypothetical protein [Glutamicibacter nicotianae]
MENPMKPGVHAINQFDRTKQTLFFAVYDDGTSGPERKDRDKAEKDFRDANTASGAVRADIERYGRDSSVFRAWGKIHKDFKDRIDGRRVCLVFDTLHAGTTSTTWRGPKALES